MGAEGGGNSTDNKSETSSPRMLGNTPELMSNISLNSVDAQTRKPFYKRDQNRCLLLCYLT